MSAEYRAAIIGHTGQGNYGHGLDMVYARMPEVEVVAVADPDPKGLAAAWVAGLAGEVPLPLSNGRTRLTRFLTARTVVSSGLEWFGMKSSANLAKCCSDLDQVVLELPSISA